MGTPPTVALIRGIPFFGFDPVVEIGGYPLHRSLDQRYTLFWLRTGSGNWWVPRTVRSLDQRYTLFWL